MKFAKWRAVVSGKVFERRSRQHNGFVPPAVLLGMFRFILELNKLVDGNNVISLLSHWSKELPVSKFDSLFGTEHDPFSHRESVPFSLFCPTHKPNIYTNIKRARRGQIQNIRAI